ncbi:MAG: alpha/beta hydrolase [Cyanobacteria bacterium J06634_6]
MSILSYTFKRALPGANGLASRTVSRTVTMRFRLRLLWGMGLGLFQVAIALFPQTVRSTQAAERITFSLGGTIERTISVESLEIYVNEGRITDELAPYEGYINDIDPNALDAARTLLSQRADIDVTTVSQFTYTPQGEYLLDEVGKVFRTGARLPGGYGLRGAAILSAADDEEGLTILNVIKRFPTPVLRVDLARGLAIARQTSESLNQSDAATRLVEQLSLQSATIPFPKGQSAAMLNQLANQAGAFDVRQLSVRVKASSEPVDIYLPQATTNVFSNELLSNNILGDGSGNSFGSNVAPPPFRFNVSTSKPQSGASTPDPTLNNSLLNFPSQQAQRPLGGLPTVIISHGFGNERRTYQYLAEHLAAHGFAVISVEHPGSSAEQFAALVSGRTSQVVADEEFTRRPQLISEVLDELEARAAINKSFSTINFNNVGVIGQSFGGYTALAVSGAPINFDSLKEDCPPEFTVNPSLFLQCQAMALAPENGSQLNLSDDRIRAVVAINPVTSAIFGPDSMAQIEVPMLMMTSSADTITPALTEQIRPFTWLTNSDRYLLLFDGGTHFSTIGTSGDENFLFPPELVGTFSAVGRRYTEVMSLAFLNTYLKGDSRYQPILSSAFTTRFSEPELPLSLITDLQPNQLSSYLQLAADDRLPDAIQAVERTVDQLAGDQLATEGERQPATQQFDLELPAQTTDD